MQEIIEQRVSQLKQKSFEELSQIESGRSEKVIEDGRTLVISIWKDFISDDELRVVVQVYRHWILGIGKMAADGFRVNGSGDVFDLKKEELYEYI